MNTPLWQLSATALVDGFRRQHWTPSQALASVRARLDEVNPLLNAVVVQAPDAEAAAEAATERYRKGEPLSPIDGVPISIKDNLLLRGVPCSWGTPALATHLVEKDEVPVARLRQAGAVLFGKTNVPEFTLEGYTANPVYGVTRNPWDPATTPGGSSGGAVAAVAAGIGPLALCTDGGGSIRRPAAHCHLFGFKPAIGAVARGEGLPQLLLDMEVVGPVARCAEDLELLYRVLSAHGDAPVQPNSALDSAGQPFKRVLWVDRFGAHTPVDPGIRQAVDAGCAELKQLGIDLVKGELPLDLDALNQHWSHIGEIGLASLAQVHPAWLEQASEPYREMAERGRQASAIQLWQILELLTQLRLDVARLFDDWDAVLMPTIAAPAWPAETRYPEQIDGESAGPRGHAVFTGWVNAAGCAAINLPLPVPLPAPRAGMQLIAPAGRETALFRLAREFQLRTGPAALFPELWSRLP